MICGLGVLLQIQLSAYNFGKQWRMAQVIGILHPCRRQEETPGSQPWISSSPDIVAIWGESQLMESISVSVVSVKSAFQIKQNLIKHLKQSKLKIAHIKLPFYNLCNMAIIPCPEFRTIQNSFVRNIISIEISASVSRLDGSFPKED